MQDNIKILLMYINVILFMELRSLMHILPMTGEEIGHLNIIIVALIMISVFGDLLKSKKLAIPIIIYTFIILIHGFISGEKVSVTFSWLNPCYVIIACASISPKKYKYIKYLGMFYLWIFVFNAGIGLYERLTHSYVFKIDPHNEVLWFQTTYGELESRDFRAFALFGHPLINANIMAIMAFSIFFSNQIKSNQRLFLFLFGLIGVICFNSRGALLFCILFIIPSIYNYWKISKRNRLYIYIVLFLLGVFAIRYFDVWGGRLITTELDDGSTQVRLNDISIFLKYTYQQMLFGGYYTDSGLSENSILLIIMDWGLILGGIKLACELTIALRIMPSIFNFSTKFVILSTYFVIGAMNRNLYEGVCWPFFIYSLYLFNNFKRKEISLI